MKTFKDIVEAKVGPKELPLQYAGYHLQDQILDGFTVEDLQTILVSNFSSDTLDVKKATKEFNSLLNDQIRDARVIGKKVIAEMAKTLPKHMKS